MNQQSRHTDSLPVFLQDRLRHVKLLCRKHRVRYLYVVGSVLNPQVFRPNSDVDLIFALDEAAISDEEYNPNLWSFWRSLEVLFGRKVDLIHGPSLKNPFFIAELEKTKRLLYAQQKEQIPLGYSLQH